MDHVRASPMYEVACSSRDEPLVQVQLQQNSHVTATSRAGHVN